MQKLTMIILFQETNAEFDPSCCTEMNVSFLNVYCVNSFKFKVAFFYPNLPSSAKIKSFQSKYTYSLTATPEIDAGFYFDLFIKSLTAVHNMKSRGSWPEMTYTKCSDYTSNVPIHRALDLASSLRVN